MREQIIERLGDTFAGTGGSDFDLNPDVRPHVWLDGRDLVDENLKPASVLLPIVDRNGDMTVLLTQRTDHLNHHPGQISFPGGRVEPQDENAIDTALRETHEEIGVSPDLVEVVGCLDPYRTGTGFIITPVVGFVDPAFQLEIDEFEVAEVFEVPLSFVFDPSNHERHSREFRGQQRHFHVLPYEDRYIWGATAGMLVGFYARVIGERAG